MPVFQPPTSRRSGRFSTRGQSLVEFAFVIPILVILVVGVADFGRVFAHGLALDAAARDAAEIAANEYLADPPGAPAISLADPAPPGDPTYYDALHLRTAQVVCAETRSFANTNYDPLTTNCPGMPLILVCVHDSQDPSCGLEPFGASIPAQCGGLSTPPANSQDGSGARWVEVRVCYRFTAILQLPIISFGDIWLQRTRSFVIPCYFVLGTQECG